MRAISLALAGCALAGVIACTTVKTVAVPQAGSMPPAAVAPGQFVWYDLLTEDSAASRKFYGALLGWKFEKFTRASRPYYIIKTADGTFIGGVVGVDQPREQRGSQWLSYLSVASVERAVADATGAGARLFAGPVDLNVGTAAILADPQGALIGVARLTTALPSTPAAKTGHFFWTEYLAADDAKALAFYKNVAGLDNEVTETAGGMTYHVLKNANPRAGLFQIPPQVQQVKPNWLPYICVDDAGALATRATELGGTVLLAPNPQARKGTLAIVADPSGAAVALQKWPM